MLNPPDPPGNSELPLPPSPLKKIQLIPSDASLTDLIGYVLIFAFSALVWLLAGLGSGWLIYWIVPGESTFAHLFLMVLVPFTLIAAAFCVVNGRGVIIMVRRINQRK